MWRPPKTNWISTDYFQLSDWVRITENYQYLNNLLDKPVQLADVTLADTNALPFYTTVNKLEQNMEAVHKAFKFENVQFTPTIWYPIVSPAWTHNPSFEDFNRWESLSYKLYETYRTYNSQVNYIVTGTAFAGPNRLVQTFSRGRKYT